MESQVDKAPHRSEKLGGRRERRLRPHRRKRYTEHRVGEEGLEA